MPYQRRAILGKPKPRALTGIESEASKNYRNGSKMVRYAWRVAGPRARIKSGSHLLWCDVMKGVDLPCDCT